MNIDIYVYYKCIEVEIERNLFSIQQRWANKDADAPHCAQQQQKPKINSRLLATAIHHTPTDRRE
jgi:hypothetical protein